METQDMQHQVMGYDRAATMFSPDGHILQVEYAEKTVRLGSASIAMACSDGVVILADKRIGDSLIVNDSANKVYEIDSHIIGTAAGILSDARILIERAQLIAQQHRVTYDSPVDVVSIIKDLADIKQQFTQHPGVRPFGISVMIAGVDDRPRVYTSDVTGNYFEYHANAIGENDEKIKDKLRQQFKPGITTEEALKLGISIFKEVKGKNFNIEHFDAAIIPAETETQKNAKDKKDKKVQRLNGDKLKRYAN